MDLDACYQAALDVCKKAGVLIKEAYSAEKRIQTKASAADLVTETDQAVEKMVISTLKSQFPTHSFIGEESVAGGEKCVWTDNPTWMIDPIDGTTNFVHRFPFSCISLALTVNKKTEIGIVYNPILEQMYTARTGQGAFCNGEKLSVTKTQDIGQALVCAEFGSDRDPEKLETKIATKKRVIEKCHGIRCVGSAALAMCSVAAGYADAFYECGIHCWDIAAADLVVREAGGVVNDPKGGPVDLMSRRVLCASTKELAEQLVGLVEPIEYERD